MNHKLKCVVVDDEPVAREILETYIDKTPNLELIGTFNNAIDVIQFLKQNTIDLFFLDINMPEINGVSLAKIINKQSHIIFTTAYRDYAIDGFDLDVIDYLLKPIAFDRFIQAIQKVPADSIPQQNFDPQKKQGDFFFVRHERKMVKINFDEIQYIESMSDYIKIHLNKKTIITRETISNVENRLPQSNFLRVHRSFIVSVKCIEAYTNEYVEVNKKSIPISRNYKETVLQKLVDI